MRFESKRRPYASPLGEGWSVTTEVAHVECVPESHVRSHEADQGGAP